MPTHWDNGVIHIVTMSPMEAFRNFNNKLRNDKTISNYLRNKGYNTLSNAAKAIGYGQRKKKRNKK